MKDTASTYTIAARELEALRAAGVNDDAAIITVDFRREARDYGAELVMEAKSIIRKLERVVEYVEKGLTINSLGELQGRGPGFDVMCALYVEKARTAKRASFPHRDVLDAEDAS